MSHQHYNFTQSLDAPNFTIQIDPAARYGYFEHHELGDECGGGLWFEPDGKTLADYDGVFELPGEVASALLQGGYVVHHDLD